MIKKALIVLVTLLVGTLIAAAVLFQMTFGAVAPMPKIVSEIQGGTLQIPDSGYVNVFAVPTGAGKVVLIDCGNDTEAKAVKAALAERHLTVEGVLVTHGHPDHVSGCNAIGVSVRSLAAEVPFVKGEKANVGPVPKIAGAHHLDVKVGEPLSDGDVVTIGDKAIRVFALPGHTPGSAAFLVDGVLYFGDAASAGKAGDVIGPPWIFSDDVPQAVASLHALAGKLRADPSLAVTTFAFAHSASMPASLDLLAAVE